MKIKEADVRGWNQCKFNYQSCFMMIRSTDSWHSHLKCHFLISLALLITFLCSKPSKGLDARLEAARNRFRCIINVIFAVLCPNRGFLAAPQLMERLEFHCFVPMWTGSTLRAWWIIKQICFSNWLILTIKFFFSFPACSSFSVLYISSIWRQQKWGQWAGRGVTSH